MRKHCRRTKRRMVAPTLVAMHLNPEVSLQERAAVLALRGGWAETSHFNVLAGIALMNIKDRYQEKRRMGATGDELLALDALCDTSEDFWKRQGGGLFIDAEAALSRAREMHRRAA